MKPAPDADSDDALMPVTSVAVKRYSLPAMLRELKRDRGNKAFTMEKLDRQEIDEIFNRPPPSGP